MVTVKIITGLGNPGARYAQTRHNLGFWVLDALSKRWQIPLVRHRFQARYGTGLVDGKRVVLVKPQTFMNRSGEAVSRFVQFYRAGPTDLLVVYDDLDLAPGLLRLKGSGSSGGHRGMENIIAHLGFAEFARLRLGIGRPPEFLEAADYVLQGIAEAELKIFEDASLKGVDAVDMWLKRGLHPAMNHFNRRQAGEC